METIDNLKKRLEKKLNNEYKEYMSELRKLSTDEVIEKSYETTLKKQFLKLLRREHSGERNEIKALLNADNALDELYEQWDHDVYELSIIINDNFIYSFNEIVENYEVDVEDSLESCRELGFFQKIADVLNEADNYNYCDDLKEKYGVSEFDVLLIDEILMDRDETRYLHDFLIDIDNDEHIQYLCENHTFNNEYYNNIQEIILPKLKEYYKELDKNKSKKNKEIER